MDVPQIDFLRVVSRSHQTEVRAKTGVRLWIGMVAWLFSFGRFAHVRSGVCSSLATGL